MTFYTSNADELAGGSATPGIAKRNDDGSIIWQVEVSANSNARKILIHEEGLFYLSASDILRLNPDNGSEVWKVPTAGFSRGFDLHPSNGKIYVGENNRSWFSIDYIDGGNKTNFSHFSFPFASAVNDVAINEDGRVYISNGINTAIQEVDPDSGAELNSIMFDGTGSSGFTGVNAIRFHRGELYACGEERNSSGEPGGIKKFDLDLTTITDITLAGDCAAFEFNGDFVYWLDTENNLIRKTALDTGADEWTVSFDPATTDSASLNYAISTNGFTVAHIDAATNIRIRSAEDGALLNSITRGDGDGFGASLFLGLSGPTDPEQFFKATYANASAAPPKETALIRPLDVQRSIDTDVAWLARNPKTWRLRVLIDIEDLDFYKPGAVFFVRADRPGLRQGRKVLLKGFSVDDVRPTEPVDVTFTAPTTDPIV